MVQIQGKWVVVIIAGLLLLAGLFRVAPQAADPPSNPAGIDTGVEKRVIHLYFADPDYRYLRAEQRVLAPSPAPAAFARQIVAALVEGPQSALKRTLPKGTRIRSVYCTPGGTAYVDLSRDVSNRHPGGCRREQLGVFAIVNSLVLNVEQVRAVKLLVNGRETPSLAGHLDLRYPFKADMLLVR